MKVKANAKINLCLDVVRKREDGYHEMDMIMIPLSLHDTITVEKQMQDHYECLTGDMMIDEQNTIYRAVELMRHTFDLTDHFHIVLEKHIPMEAGLAGGSADAAAVMKALWKMYELPCTISELAELGKQIGADVPFCVRNTCALVRGIGEQITPFHNACDFFVLLVKPDSGVSTKKAFALLDFTKCTHPDTNRCKKALENRDFSDFCAHSGNTLEYSAFTLVPQLQDIKQQLQHMGLPFVLMSGSGSTIFALSDDEEQLMKCAQQLKQTYPFVTVCQPING